MKLLLIRVELVTTALLIGCGGATSIDKNEYPDDGYGLGWQPGDSTDGTGGAESVDTWGGGHPSTGPGSKGGTTGSVKTSSKGGSTAWTSSTSWTTSKGGSTTKGGTTSWTSSKGGSTWRTGPNTKGGTTSRTTTMSKGGVGNWSSTWTSKGGSTYRSGTTSTYCLYDDRILPVGYSFTLEDGCTFCYCDQNGGINCTAETCSCVYFGEYLWSGDGVMSRDGCNKCQCQQGGVVTCSTYPCTSACTYAGYPYADGDTFVAVDGCNKCACSDGVVTCGSLDCSCNPDKEYWRQYVAHTTNECASINYRCQPGATPFSNACGCGCEQSPDCPSYFDCPLQYVGVGGTTGTWPGYSGGAPGTGTAGSTYYSPTCPDSARRAACPLSGVSSMLL